MSNLENITKKILDDAKLEVKEIEKITKEKIDEIINPKVEAAEAESARILKRAKEDVLIEKDKITDSANLKARDEILSAKQKAIAKIFDYAKKKLADISDDQYLSIIETTLKKLDIDEEKVLIIQKDRKLKKDLGIKISEEEFTNSGFQILDGKTLLNFNFADLVEADRLELEGEVASKLFKRG